ncbi:phosphate signaling complex protein PhoU [Anoxybacillus sp. PDR2]|uniref:phosphate signaling complex protein PhoU n=1 Tax=Anoxybacillus sp. PDR2 TaxID=1636720 RepID=UPI0013189469|nr:phosphate signaling complex protein PhoU [Anoxybacillus sp. PDR2]QHC04777.1 phosphate signaling complex protein PhoU [Anoxybacillus sp. PDR2]
MPAREKFDYDLKTLQQKLLELGSLTETALNHSIQAFQHKNIELALQIIDNDSQIDTLEEEINDFAILLIAKQQPVAIDLRRIVIAIKIATDIERIADFAVDIAKAAIRMGDRPFALEMEKIMQMHRVALEMVSIGLKAYYEEDVVLARKIAEMDDEVDELYGQIMRELLRLNATNQENALQINQFSLIARYIERIADHATNLGEHVVYLVKGKHYDLNG